MSGYHELLRATVAHLEALQADGVRHVPVTREILAALVTTTPQPRNAKASLAPVRPSAAPILAPDVPAPLPSPVPVRSIPAAATARWSQALRPTAPPKPTGSVASTAPLQPPLPPKLDPANRVAAMEELRRRTLACVKCSNLAASRTSVVFGVGDLNARLMFVGEAPGADEDRQGEPFVGKAGELLTRIITAMNLGRDQVFIANILKCRPDTPGQATGNRKPTPEEMATCVPWLHEQINLIQPEVLVALGGTAVEGLLGKTAGITRLRGQWQTYRGIPLMPTYHPAYLMYTQVAGEKRRVWEDMLAVMERLSLPITEKQRGFFLPK